MNQKEKWIQTGRESVYVLWSMLALTPAFFLLIGQIPTVEAWHVYLSVCLTFCLVMTCRLSSGRRRPVLAALSLCVLVAQGFFLIPVRVSWLLVIIPALECIFLLILIRNRDPRKDVAVMTIGILFYAVCQFLVQRSRYSDVIRGYGRLETDLLVTFLFFAALTLLELNSRTLRDQSLGIRTPASVRTRNRILILSLGALAVLLALIPWISEQLSIFARWLRHVAMVVLDWITSLLPQTSTDGGGGGGGDLSGMLGAGEKTEPSLLAVILEKVAIGLAVLAAAFLLGFGLWKLSKLIRRGLRRLMGYLSRYVRDVSEDYSDVVTDMRDDQDWKAVRKRVGRKKGRRREDRSSPSTFVRYRYGCLVDSHPEWKDSDTARVHLSEFHAEIYEKARYSPEGVSQQEADRFRPDEVKG